MGLTKLTADLNIISPLSDLPNTEDGLTPEAMKDKFDEAANIIKDFINLTNIPELEDAINAAAQGIGFDGVGTNSIADFAITTAKLHQTEGSEAVTTETIRDRAVTLSKLSASLQNTINVLQERVATVTTMLSSVITSYNNVLEVLETKQAQHKTATVTLESGQTTWTKSVTGVTASNDICVSPQGEASNTEWVNCGVKATAQAAGTVTFKADTTTENAIDVGILIFD